MKKIPERIQEEDEIVQDRGSLTPEQDALAQKAKYDSKGTLSKIPPIFKYAFAKFWFAGAACYFIIWGVFGMLFNSLDTVVVVGLIIGVLSDFLIVPFLKLTEGVKLDAHKYIMFRFAIPNKVLSYFVSITCTVIYSALVCYGVVLVYNLINVAAISAGAVASDAIALPVEPILFGVFYTAIDLLIISTRNIIIRLLKRNKEKDNV